jgi:hypothetical protein
VFQPVYAHLGSSKVPRRPTLLAPSPLPTACVRHPPRPSRPTPSHTAARRPAKAGTPTRSTPCAARPEPVEGHRPTPLPASCLLPLASILALTPHVPDFCHQVIDLCALDAETLVGDVKAQVIIKLMRAVLSVDGESALHDGFAALRLVALGSDHLSFIRMGLRYLAHAAPPVDKTTLLRHIEVLNNQQVKEEAMTLADQIREWGREEGLELGLERGREQGREQGREEGLRLGRIDSLRRIIQLRFGPVPPAVDARIASATQPQLAAWMDAVLDARTINDVFDAR